MLHQRAGRRFVRLLHRAILDQFQGAHRTQAPHLSNPREFFEPRLQTVFQKSPQLPRVLQSLWIVEFIHHGQRCRTGHRISGVSAAHASDSDRIDHLGFAHDRRKRQTIGQPFRQDQQIRRHAGLLASKERSCPTEPCLDLVEDKHHTMLVAPLAQHAQERRGRRNESPLARHRLNDHRGNIRLANIRARHFFKLREGFAAQTPRQRTRQFARTNRRRPINPRPPIKIRKRRAINFRRKRTKPAFVGIRLPGQRHRHVRASVERVLEANHRLTLRIRARKLDRVLHRLRPGAGEKRLLGKIPRRPRIEPLGHFDVALVSHHIDARVEKFIRLRLGRRHDGRLAMPEIRHPDPAGKIQERIAVQIRNRRPLRPFRHNRRRMKRSRRHVLGPLRKNRLTPRPGHWSF